MNNQTVSDAQIAEAAFYIWLEEGQPAGRDFDHWVQAKTTLESAQAKPRKRAAAKPKAAAAKTAEKAVKAKKATPRKAAAKKAPLVN